MEKNDEDELYKIKQHYLAGNRRRKTFITSIIKNEVKIIKHLLRHDEFITNIFGEGGIQWKKIAKMKTETTTYIGDIQYMMIFILSNT